MKYIYTAIIGDYDTLKEPLVYTTGWEYVCFTDNKNLKSNTWTIIDVSDKEELRTLDNVRKARYIKIMFHKFFKEGTIIWHDANMVINCDLDIFLNRFWKDTFTALKHPDRSCAYEEAIACVRLNKEDQQIVSIQMDKYYDLHYPEDNGLAATGILIRSFDVLGHRIICENWWHEVLFYSKRDQLSLDFVIWEWGRSAYNRLAYDLIPFYVLLNYFILQKHDGANNRRKV